MLRSLTGLLISWHQTSEFHGLSNHNKHVGPPQYIACYYVLMRKMNLLPQTEVDFAQTKYWNKFFRERGSKEFEWYGEYAELCEALHQYLKTKDSILVIGCGNSMLSSHLYDFGCRKITNIDISSVVIRQMKSKIGNKRPEMVFEEMDALNMSFEQESFSVVLDKGTLDALMPSDTENDQDRAKKLFSEVDRVLKLSGRYIIISLLQEHILRAILSNFMERGWMIRISRCWDVEKKNIAEKGCLTMPVFMIVCVKFRKVKDAQPILEINAFTDGKSKRIKSMEEVLTIVKGIQGTIFHCKEAQGEMEIKFCRIGEEKPRYTIYVVDASKDPRKLLKYAAFIVPHGRETEWMFGSKDGRSYLRESSGFDRLAVITFHRCQSYGSLLEVQDELRQSILQLAPSCMPLTAETPNIPYLTLGDGIGHRETVYFGTSELSGDLLVEDIKVENEIFRRLIFLNNQAVVQSEVKMKKVLQKDETDIKDLVDFSYVSSDHVLYMSIAAALKVLEKSSASVAVIGVGGGALCLLLRDLFPNITVTGIELDPLVIELAQKYFGLKVDERLKIIVNDGVKFLKEKNKFDVIMFDVDSKQLGSALSCPPLQFIEPSVLNAVAESLGDEGVFVTNVVSRLKSEHDKLIRKVKQHFNLISAYNLKEDVNRIVFACNNEKKSEIQWQEEIKKAALAFDKTLNDKLKSRNETIDLNDFLARLNIE